MDLVIQPGMTYYRISSIFNVPLQQLLNANPYTNPSMLRIGQVIKVPYYQTHSYKIQSGDTLWSVSQNNQIPLDQILATNPIDPYQLRVGDTITLPVRINNDILNFDQLYTSDV